MQKRLLYFLPLFFFSFHFSYSQNPGEWMWIHGDNTPNNPGNFGIQGVPSPTNEPPALYEACEWTDLQGNFWLYGGVGGSTWNDLWKYDPVNNEWTWMTGTHTNGYAGNYGTQGIPSPLNLPPSKGWGTLSWVDLNGNLWMFGGQSPSERNDLWKYDISTNQWTWMKGPNTPGQQGVFGTQGIPDAANNPSVRTELATAWTDNNGDLWFFGGRTTINSFVGRMNDLWRFNISTNTWTWMKGSNVINPPSVYGVKGIESAASTPGCREAYCRWKDNNGNLWLFGGFKNPVGSLNDLWRFNPVTNNWTWVSGDTVGFGKGSYGTKCVPSPANNPASRTENRSVWTDLKGNFWMFGGSGLNDLWMFNVTTGNWTWISGDSINPTASFGTINVSSPTNKPGAKSGALGWSDQTGHLYLFGSGTNELWKYTIDSNCYIQGSLPIPHFISSDTSFCNESGSCIDFTDQSTNNPTGWKWFFSGAVPATSTQQNPTNICYSTPGTYAVKLIVINSLGSDSLTISPMITFATSAAPPVLTRSNDTIFCSHAAAYQWYFNGSPILNATDSFYVFTSNGVYAVQITDDNGCTRLSDGFPVSVEEMNGLGGIKIYPNPAKNQFTVYSLRFTVNSILKIYNVLGEKVLESEITNQKFEINVSRLMPGVYFLHLKNEQNEFVGKLLKQ